MLINRKQNKEKSSEQIKLNFGVAEGLAAENANLWYGDFQALKGITMDIPAQKVTAFIGPSGCGKSTFLKCFNRMNDLVDGCRIEGKFTVGGVEYVLEAGETLIMPKGIPHAVFGLKRFKMMLTVSF